MTPTLVLPPRYTADSNAIWKAAITIGWHVERLQSWRVDPNQFASGAEIVLYGEPLFAAVVVDQLGIELIEPTFDWLTTIPYHFTRRQIEFAHLRNARTRTTDCFIKPANDKVFPARVYASGTELPNNEAVPDDTPVLISQTVTWVAEFRCFVLDRQVQTMSPYLRYGELARAEDGSWPFLCSEREDALEFAQCFLSDSDISSPPAMALDIGIIEDRGWAILEANPAWGSGIYGCDPACVLPVIRRACCKRGKSSEMDRQWILER